MADNRHSYYLKININNETLNLDNFVLTTLILT